MGWSGDFDEEERVAAALGYVAHVTLLLSQYLDVPLRYPVLPGSSRSSILDYAPSHHQQGLEGHAHRRFWGLGKAALHQQQHGAAAAARLTDGSTAQQPGPGVSGPGRGQVLMAQQGHASAESQQGLVSGDDLVAGGASSSQHCPAAAAAAASGAGHGALQLPLFYVAGDRTRFAYAIFLLNKDLEQLLHAHGMSSSGPNQVLANLYKLMSAAASGLPSQPLLPPQQQQRRIHNQQRQQQQQQAVQKRPATASSALAAATSAAWLHELPLPPDHHQYHQQQQQQRQQPNTTVIQERQTRDWQQQQQQQQQLSPSRGFWRWPWQSTPQAPEQQQVQGTSATSRPAPTANAQQQQQQAHISTWDWGELAAPAAPSQGRPPQQLQVSTSPDRNSAYATSRGQLIQQQQQQQQLLASHQAAAVAADAATAAAEATAASATKLLQRQQQQLDRWQQQQQATHGARAAGNSLLCSGAQATARAGRAGGVAARSPAAGAASSLPALFNVKWSGDD